MIMSFQAQVSIIEARRSDGTVAVMVMNLFTYKFRIFVLFYGRREIVIADMQLNPRR